jgi:hypothetical protein
MKASWNLPTEADIYVDRIPPGSIAVLAGMRRLLGLAWPLSGLRDLLATQPLLTVEAGNPRTLRQALISEGGHELFRLIYALGPFGGRSAGSR